jgi:N6-adenosine-specific RNA methylase IME4
MRRDEWTAFLADVRLRGIVEPLVVRGSTVLDGRHRLRAAKELNLAFVPVHEVDLDGEGAREFMLKSAVLRRHMTDDQRRMCAALWAKIERMYPGRSWCELFARNNKRAGWTTWGNES